MAAVELGPVERPVSLDVEVLRAVRLRRHADAQRNRNGRMAGAGVSVFERHLLDQDPQPLGDRADGVLVHAVDDQGELLAAGAGHEHVLAGAGAEQAGDGLKDAVADRMAEAVVDILEAVDIGEDQRVEQDAGPPPLEFTVGEVR